MPCSMHGTCLFHTRYTLFTHSSQEPFCAEKDRWLVKPGQTKKSGVWGLHLPTSPFFFRNPSFPSPSATFFQHPSIHVSSKETAGGWTWSSVSIQCFCSSVFSPSLLSSRFLYSHWEEVGWGWKLDHQRYAAVIHCRMLNVNHPGNLGNWSARPF